MSDNTLDSPAEAAEQPAAATEQPAAAAPPPKAERRGPLRRILELFWRGRALAEARGNLPERSAEQERLVQYARAAIELGSRALDPVDPLRAGQGTALAATLFREALTALEAAFERTLPPAPVESEAVAERMRALLAPEALLDHLREGSDVTRDDARALQRAARGTLAQIDAPRRQVRKLLTQRILRAGLAFAAFVAATVATVLFVQSSLAGPDLAQGKPWTTSSIFPGFSKEKGELDGKKTTLLFHTNREQGPWISFDLGRSMTIHRVDVVNRKDCCEDRAIPLIVEASPDGENWTEVIRRTETFGSWTAKFSPVTTRYVRLRVDKKTWLHLDEVHIR